jgi:hypothetical protein
MTSSRIHTPRVIVERVRAVEWLVPGRTIRTVSIEDEAWFVVMDLCWALGIHMSSNGKPNVTAAFVQANIEERRFVRIETDPGSFKPYTRYAVTSRAGVIALVERGHFDTTGAALARAPLNSWIERAAREVNAKETKVSLDIAG